MEKIAIFLFIKDITLDGGSERKVVSMANEFVKRYPQVSIISRFSTNTSLHYSIDKQVSIFWIEPQGTHFTDAPRANYFLRLVYLFRYAWAISKPINHIVKTHTPKGLTPVVILLGYETPLWKPKGAKFIGLDTSCAIVWRSQRILGRIYMRVRRWMQHSLDIAGVLSDLQLEDWALLRKPIRILTNFVANIPANVPDQSQREKIIVAAGRMMDEQKGFDRLITYYAKIAAKYPEWKLRIFGEGPLKLQYQALIDNMGAGKYIELLPFSKNIYAEYQRASIFVMTSRWEGFGLVTAEAMGCGAVPVAVAANKPSGTSFILRDLPECLAPENDMVRFQSILERMMTDEQLRQKTAAKARRIVMERFSWEALMQTWEQVFDEFISKTK